MKKCLFTMFLILSVPHCLLSQEYEMVVEKTDGTKTVFKTSELSQIYYQKIESSENTGTFQGAKRVFGNNLVKAYGRNDYDRYELTYNDKGFVTAVKRTKYGSSGSADKVYNFLFTYADDKIICNEFVDGSLYLTMTAYIGSNGYVSRMESTAGYGCTFTYNEDDMLTSTKNFELSDESKYETDSYVYSDGDIVSRYVDGVLEASIAYQTPSQITPILNTYGMMEYDHGLGIDVDDNYILYWVGGMGKGTKHLPLAWTHKDSSYTKSNTNTWEMDSQGRVVKLTTNSTYTYSYGDPYTTTYTFFWEW